MSKRRDPPALPRPINPLSHQRLLRLFNPNPKVDYYALTSSPFPALLAGSLAHSELMILAQPRVGITIKTGDAGGGEG